MQHVVPEAVLLLCSDCVCQPLSSVLHHRCCAAPPLCTVRAAGKLAFAEFQPALQRMQQAKRVAAAAQRSAVARTSAFVAPPPEPEGNAAGLDDGGDAYGGSDGAMLADRGCTSHPLRLEP